MTHSENAQLTALIRNMKRVLERDHAVSVPHSALRAAYLSAQGENPHAFGQRRATPAHVAHEAAASIHCASPALQDYVLHLVEDDDGCLERLALRADGIDYPVPDDFDFAQAQVTGLYAKVPSVARYGLPQYLEDTAQFFEQRFSGLRCARQLELRHEDLGDDSGDCALVRLAMSREQWLALLLAIAQDTGLYEDAAHESGLHHRVNLDTAPDKAERVERYMQSIGVLFDPGEPVEGRMEWLYADQDSDFVDASVDPQSGVITLCAPLPAEASHPEVVLRFCADTGAMSEEPFAVIRARDGGWKLTLSALAALLDEL